MLLPWQNILLLSMRNVGLSQLQLIGKKLKVQECKCRPIWFSLPHIIFSCIFLRSKAKNNTKETSGIKLSMLCGALYVGLATSSMECTIIYWFLSSTLSVICWVYYEPTKNQASYHWWSIKVHGKPTSCVFYDKQIN